LYDAKAIRPITIAGIMLVIFLLLHNEIKDPTSAEVGLRWNRYESRFNVGA
jgi:hypothetical protein